MRERLKGLMPPEEHLISEAGQAREKAKTLQPAEEQDTTARQSETAARIDRWINSPGLRPPK